MHILLIILAYLAFAFGAPIKVTIATSIILLLVTLAIQYLTKSITDIQSSFSDAFKAIGLSFFFLFLVLLFFASAVQNPISLILLAINPFLIPVGLFGAFALGFALSLRMTVAASSVVAALSSIFAAGLIIATRKFIF